MADAQELSRLLARDQVAVRAEAELEFERRRTGRPVVLHGAGNIGRALLSALRSSGIEPLCFSDRGHGDRDRELDGLAVLTPQQAAQAHGQEALFVVTVFNPSSSYNAIRRDLLDLGVADTCPWIVPAWAYRDAMLPRFAADGPDIPIAHAAEIQRVLEMLSDDASRREFVAQACWRLTGDYTLLGEHEPLSDQYFSGAAVQLRPDEVFVDCGAFDGDTLRSLAVHGAGQVGHVYALEPDVENHALLTEAISELPDRVREAVEVIPWAAGRERGFASWGGSDSSAGIVEGGSTTVEVRPLDELLERGPIPTFVKMDIEGAEPDALAGARRIIEHRPIIAVSLYHTPAHLWELPLQIAGLVDGAYSYFVRRYEEDSFELVLFAVPNERVPS